MSLPRDDEWNDPGSMDPPSRRGRRVLVVVAFFAIAAVGSLLIWRAASLRGLPDIGEPFDTRALGTVSVPDDENAFTYYRKASAKLVGLPSTNKPFISWGEVPLADKDWFFANAPAISLWFEGTVEDRALYYQPKDMQVDTPLKVAATASAAMKKTARTSARSSVGSPIGSPKELTPSMARNITRPLTTV